MVAFLAMPSATAGPALVDASISISAGRLTPANVTISAGGSVTFRNQDVTPHAIVANGTTILGLGPLQTTTLGPINASLDFALDNPPVDFGSITVEGATTTTTEAPTTTAVPTTTEPPLTTTTAPTGATSSSTSTSSTTTTTAVPGPSTSRRPATTTQVTVTDSGGGGGGSGILVPLLVVGCFLVAGLAAGAYYLWRSSGGTPPGTE